MRARLPWSLLLALGTSLLQGCAAAEPCTLSSAPPEIQPLLIGDTTRLQVGTVEGTSCRLDQPQAAVWAGDSPAVASVSADGVARGVHVGEFRARAVVGSHTLTVAGFVLPRGWRAQIVPETLTVAVGDTARFLVRPISAAGEPLPVVPFSLYNAEWMQLTSALLERRQQEWDSLMQRGVARHIYGVREPRGFVTTEPGLMRVWGVIGATEVQAQVQVVAPPTPRVGSGVPAS